MRASVIKRLGFADPSVEVRADPGLMARTLMYLFAAGGAVALGSLAIASPAHVVRIVVTGAICWGAAAALLVIYDALTVATFELALAGGIALTCWAVQAGGAASVACAGFLFCAAVYSVYFFSKPVAAAHMAMIVGGFTAAALLRAGVPAAEWLVIDVALVTAAGVVAAQRATANRLIWRLADVARTDPLTGLLNRRGFEELIETELERSRRSGQPLSLIAGDLDHFKALNDRFGHGAGDRALEQVALILQTAKRRIDTAARIGGEEFAMILPDSDHHAAYILAERMRREIRETFVYEPYELTVSLGVATFPVHATTADALVAQADEALYGAKALGRDRTVVYSEELGESVFEMTGEESPRAARHSATVLALADVIDGRESGRPAHSQAVGRYAAAIARELGLPDEVIERIRFGGVVHDVGKIGVPEAILRKPGWLSAEDWLELRRHPEIGARILSSAQLEDVGEWVRAHHERPDGTGYPDGLQGPEIPLEARILAVADAYEAMTSDRVYRAAMSVEEARAELERCAGTQFDRRVVEAFLRLLDGSGRAHSLRLAH